MNRWEETLSEKKEIIEFYRKKHIKYLERILDGVPGSFGAQETNLMTLVYFCVSGLDLLDAADVLKKRRDQLLSFIYSLGNISSISGLAIAFFGNLSDVALNSASAAHSNGFRVGSSIATTWAGLNVLSILGDDLTGVDRPGMAQYLKTLQAADGSFRGIIPLYSSDTTSIDDQSETDMRFVYCACAISAVIGDWTGVDIPKTLSFIWRSRTYEGGFAQYPGAECHGGSTYCAVAAAKLIYLAQRRDAAATSGCEMDRGLVELFAPNATEERHDGVRQSLIRWCVARQTRGFTGRANKPEDSCYAFWLGATLTTLNAFDFVDERALEEFCMETQDNVLGGFAKWPEVRSDPLHTYLCMSGLSLVRAHQLHRQGDVLGLEASPTEECPDSEEVAKSATFLLKPVNPVLNIAETHMVALFFDTAP